MKSAKGRGGEADFIMFSTIMLLLSIGIIMIYSASAWTSGIKYGDDMYFLKRQLMWAVIGIIVMIVLMGIDYHKLKRITGIAMIATIPLLLAVFAFPAINGARRWIPLGFANLQPSEIAKYVVVLYLAKSMDYKGEKIKSFIYGVAPYLLISGFYAGLVLAEKNLSICSVIMIVTFILLFVAGARAWHTFGIVTPIGLLAGIFLIFSADYRRARLLSFLDPWKDASGDGYQLIQSLLALGSGGIWGLGLGQSRQKCYYMPEPHNDFIFAIIGEELGLIGCIFLIMLFVIFVWRGIRTAINAKDTYGTLLATGITSIIAVQAIINIAVVTGSMPVTGVPLPFISYGGSSLVINLAAMGVLLNISRQSSSNKIKL
ncbi:MAG: stage V sporulation protein E [Bacillota bacterium]|nr:stage V sporulation protein E [Bacillota bacterium]